MTSSTNENQKSAGGRADVAKWIVIGTVCLTFLLLFRGELSRLLDRVTGIDVSSSGVKIKTADTPLGKTEVSSVQVKSTSSLVDGIQGTTYVSRQYGFEISWPDGTNWKASDTLGRTLHQQMGLSSTVEIPIVIQKTQLVGNFRPNVNVLVESVGNVSIGQYMNSSVQSMKQMGWVILSSNVDEATQGGLLVILNTSSGGQLYQFQRIAISRGRAYVVTATQVPPEDLLSQELREELRSILNSFRLIT